MTVTLNVNVDWRGFDQQVWRLNNIDMFNVWRKVGNEVVQITKENMGPDGGPRPKPWAPLSPRYAKWVQKHSPPPVPTLIRLTRRLFNSIGSRASQNGVVVFSDAPYASVHQFGSSAQMGLFHHGGIPARPFFPIIGAGPNVELTPYAMSRVQTAIAAELNRLFRGF